MDIPTSPRHCWPLWKASNKTVKNGLNSETWHGFDLGISSEKNWFLLHNIAQFLTDFLHPVPSFWWLKQRNIVPADMEREDIESFIWGLCDYTDLEKLAKGAYELAKEPVQLSEIDKTCDMTTGRDESQERINKQVRRIKETLEKISEKQPSAIQTQNLLISVFHP